MKKLQRWTIILTGTLLLVFLSQIQALAVATVVDAADKNSGSSTQERGEPADGKRYQTVADPSTYWILFFGVTGLVILITREKVRCQLLGEKSQSSSSDLLARLLLLRKE